MRNKKSRKENNDGFPEKRNNFQLGGTRVQHFQTDSFFTISYNGLLYGAYPGGYDPQYPDDLSYDEFGGIGFISGMVIDTHFRSFPKLSFGCIQKGSLSSLCSDKKNLVIPITFHVG